MSTTSERRRRRRLLYIVGLAPSLLLLLVSGRVALMLHDQAQAMTAYRASDFGSARDHFARNRLLNPIEPWVAPFGEGGAHYRDREFNEAVIAFGVALERVPKEHECMVRVNLALSHEAVGDSLLEDARTKAIEAWLKGREVLRPCKEVAEEDEAAAELKKLRKQYKRDRQKDQDQRDRDQDSDQRDGDQRDRSLDADQVGVSPSELEQQKARLAALRVDARIARKLGLDELPRTTQPDEAPPEDEETRAKKRQLEERNRKALEDNVEHKDEFETDPPPPTPEPSPTPQW